MGMNEFIGYILLFGAFIVTLIADIVLRTRYRKYRQIKVEKEITGGEVAREILKKHDLEQIYVVETRGYLSDHYDPSQKVIRLSQDVYRGNTIAALSIAAHECGHAIQDKEGYLLLRIRAFLGPLASFGTKFGYIAVIIGLLLGYFNLAWIGIGLLVFILFFQLVTLPIEIDASSRAKNILEQNKYITKKERSQAAKMLSAAALTYVASLLSTILDLLRLVLIIISNSDD